MRFGGGTIVLLCEALRDRISEALKNTLLEMEAKKGGLRVPQVVNGFLPPKRSQVEPDHPFVIVRPKDGQINAAMEQRVRLQLIIGTHSEASDGHEFGLMVLQRIIASITERPVLADRFALQLPLTWELFEEQPYPFWQLVAETDWTIAAPVMLPDEGVV